MHDRTIQGITKDDFVSECCGLADKNDPNWKVALLGQIEFSNRMVWKNASKYSGFAMTQFGARFLEEAVGVTPYKISMKHHSMSGRRIVDLDNNMPWPYRLELIAGMVNLIIYSSEVAVWAALYDNDVDKLMAVYAESKRNNLTP